MLGGLSLIVSPVRNPKVVVICPVKNESWILASFLTAASQYADHIIIGDHGSTDNTVQIAKGFSKVKIVSSSHQDFQEAERRNQLLEEARGFGEGNVILSIDADELLDPRFIDAGGVEALKELPVGTRFYFPHFNVAPEAKSFWVSPVGAIGFVDDNSLHPESDKIHFPRIPSWSGVKTPRKYRHKFGGLIHLQYLNWERVLTKTRWYKAWEAVHHPERSTLQIHRRYFHIKLITNRPKQTNPAEWKAHFDQLKISQAVEASRTSGPSWWESESKTLEAQIPQGRLRNLGLPDSRRGPSFTSNVDSRYELALKRYLSITLPIQKFSNFRAPRLLLRVLDSSFDKLFGN